MASQSESLGSQDSSRSEDETPTTSDEEFIVSDSEMEEVEQAESEEDDIELLYESFINLREENKLIKQELAKQSNLLWEIYEELKESKLKPKQKTFGRVSPSLFCSSVQQQMISLRSLWYTILPHFYAGDPS